MATIVNLPGVLPEPRFDGVAWTTAVIEEAAAPTGPWTQIDSQTLAGPDADPSAPAGRDFTTTHATLAEGWYRVHFTDGVNTSPASDPVRNSSSESALPPDPESVRRASPLLRARLDVETEPLAVADLRNLAYQATALVQSITWRLIDPTLGCPAPQPDYACEIVPPALVPVALEAITRMAERIYVTTEPDFAEQMATGRRLRGFSAGPYSESYFAPGEFARRGASQGRPAVDQDDALDQTLWALMTEDARDYFVWRATGVAPPVGQAVAWDYRRQSIGYGAGSLGGWPSRSGPDGY